MNARSPMGGTVGRLMPGASSTAARVPGSGIREVDGRDAALDLVEHGVAVAPGSAFGDAARGHARLSLACSQETLAAGVERIVAWYRATGGGASLEGDRASLEAHGAA